MSKEQKMDGMLTRVVATISVEDGPRPFATSDAMAARAVGEAHARAMAAEARRMAADCHVSPGFHIPAMFDPAAAALAADRHRADVDRRRVVLADKVRGLFEAGRLTAPQFRAAGEINELLEWAEAGRQVLARSQFRERMAASSGDGFAVQARLEEADRRHFRPWREWAGAFPVKATRSLADLTLAVVVQRSGLRQVADAFRMDQRRAEALLRRSLSCYAVLAGWETRSETA